jgi:hypothetical protein
VPTFDILHTYSPDYKVIFVGDASMSPYEILVPGGSVEHHNEETGEVWLRRLVAAYPHCVWLTPLSESYWEGTLSLTIIRALFKNRMYPLTLDGLEAAVSDLMK